MFSSPIALSILSSQKTLAFHDKGPFVLCSQWKWMWFKSLMFPECQRFQLFAFCLLSWEGVPFISGAYDALAPLCLSWWNRVKQVISHILLGLCVCCSDFLERNACSDLNPQNKESSGIDISEYRLDWGRDLDSLELVYSGTETFFQISNLEASTDYCCRLQVVHDVSNVNHCLLGPWDVCSNIFILGWSTLTR